VCLIGCGALDEAQSSVIHRDPAPVASSLPATSFAVVIATTEQPALALAVDATNVYWTAGSSVLQCSKTSCTTPAVLATDSATVQWLAVDATSVDWITHEGSAVARCTVGGCAQSPVVIPYENVWDIAAASPGARWAGGSYAVETTDVYWVDGKMLLTCSLGSCGGASDEQAGSGVLTDFAVGPRIAVDAASVYWHDLEGDIVRCPKPGCTTPTVVAHIPGVTVRDMASDGQYLYWVDGGTVHRVLVDGSVGDVAFAADGGTLVNRLALDDTRLWLTTTDADGGRVIAVEK
jgi:hypothetical protein